MAKAAKAAKAGVATTAAKAKASPRAKMPRAGLSR
jgi:hypothetical protein